MPLNRNLEAMARQLYDYWFVQFDFPDENGKPYKSSGGNMVWNDRLKREIPQGWNVDNILSICEIKVGGTPSKFNNTYWDNGSIPFLGPTDVSDNIFQLDTVDHITHEGLEHCASSLFQVGDIILTARGSIGKMVIVGEPMAMNQSCYALSPKFQNTTYLYFLSKELIEWLKAKGSGSVFKSFNVQDVEYSQLCIAPTQIIERFCNSVNCLFSQIRENTKEIATLIAQREELLPLLMNGQVSVMPREVNCDLVFISLMKSIVYNHCLGFLLHMSSCIRNCLNLLRKKNIIKNLSGILRFFLAASAKFRQSKPKGFSFLNSRNHLKNNSQTSSKINLNSF